MSSKGPVKAESSPSSAADFAVSVQSASCGTSERPRLAGISARSASTPHTAYCQRGESLSRSSHFTASSTAAASETLSV